MGPVLQVQAHLKKENYAAAFASLWGITCAAHMEDHWWHDTDDCETPCNLTKALAKSWQAPLTPCAHSQLTLPRTS